MKFHAKLFRIDMNKMNRKSDLHEWKKNYHLWLIFSCKLFFFHRKKAATDKMSAKEYEMGKESEIASIYWRIGTGLQNGNFSFPLLYIHVHGYLHEFRIEKIAFTFQFRWCAYYWFFYIFFFVWIVDWNTFQSVGVLCGGFRNAAYNRK